MAARHQQPTLADWMDRYAQGDEAAFEPLYKALAPRVRRQIKARRGSAREVEDLVQLTFMRAHAARDRYRRPDADPDETLAAWFCAIARNVALGDLRRSYRDRLEFGRGAEQEVGDATADSKTNGERAALADESSLMRRQKVREAVALLPPGQRAVIELHKFGGLSMEQVSRRLGVRAVAVRVRAHRAYQTLRALLNPDPDPAFG